jgi:hypothetical protein
MRFVDVITWSHEIVTRLIACYAKHSQSGIVHVEYVRSRYPAHTQVDRDNFIQTVSRRPQTALCGRFLTRDTGRVAAGTRPCSCEHGVNSQRFQTPHNRLMSRIWPSLNGLNAAGCCCGIA